MSEKYLVSVCVPTYKHGDWLKECIESIINQIVDFQYEILVGLEFDDNESINVLDRVENSNTNVSIRVIKNSKEGAYILNGRRSGRGNYLNLLKAAKGVFIAHCDGDDFWFDRNKLQKQVDVFHECKDVNYVFSNKILLVNEEFNRYEINLNKDCTLEKLLKDGIMPHNSTIMFRKSNLDFKKYKEVLFYAFNGDWVFLFMLASSGKIRFLSDYTSVYRSGVGVISKTDDKLKYLNGLKTNKILNKITEKRFNFHLSKREWHMENLTYCYLQKSKYFDSFKYYFKKIYCSYKENKPLVASKSNCTFTKHSLKLLLRLNQ